MDSLLGMAFKVERTRHPDNIIEINMAGDSGRPRRKQQKEGRWRRRTEELLRDILGHQEVYGFYPWCVCVRGSHRRQRKDGLDPTSSMTVQFSELSWPGGGRGYHMSVGKGCCQSG